MAEELEKKVYDAEEVQQLEVGRNKIYDYLKEVYAERGLFLGNSTIFLSSPSIDGWMERATKKAKTDFK